MRHLAVAAILLVAVTATATEEQAGGHVTYVSSPSRLSKREATLLNSIPVESIHTYRKKSKIIYRRASRPKVRSYNVHSKPKYGPPRNNYGPPTIARRPIKKNRGKPIKTQYNHLKMNPPKKHYSYSPMKQYRKPTTVYGVPKTHTPYVPQEPAGFGEPPSDHFAVNPKPSYGEPPSDSYGSLLSHVKEHQDQSYSYKPNSFASNFYLSNAQQPQESFPPNNHNNFPPNNHNSFPPNNHNSFAPNNHNSFAPNNHNSFAPSPQDSYSPSGQDSYSYSPKPAPSHSSKYQDSYANYVPDPSYAASSHSQHSLASHESNEDVVKGNGKTPPERHTDPESYSGPYDYDEESKSPGPIEYSNHQNNYRTMQGKKKRIMETTKPISRTRQGPRGRKHSDEIIVGGKYAEPPARYIAKFKPSAQVFTGSDSFVPPVRMASASDEAATSYQSSYVNYKNSNMAFSPQNLNDAFSIMNK